MERRELKETNTELFSYFIKFRLQKGRVELQTAHPFLYLKFYYYIYYILYILFICLTAIGF
jgi:hypothetical protein